MLFIVRSGGRRWSFDCAAIVVVEGKGVDDVGGQFMLR